MTPIRRASKQSELERSCCSCHRKIKPGEIYYVQSDFVRVFDIFNPNGRSDAERFPGYPATCTDCETNKLREREAKEHPNSRKLERETTGQGKLL